MNRIQFQHFVVQCFVKKSNDRKIYLNKTEQLIHTGLIIFGETLKRWSQQLSVL